jgi:catechol 2,3-dioxygenase-like lactoylglutathione lyase family enzyme
MKLILVTLAAALVSLAGASSDQPVRPKITGIDHVRLYVSSVDKSRAFYGNILGLHPSDGRCVGVSYSCFSVRWGPRKQHIELEQAPSPAPKNWLAEVAFATDDVARMRRYLIAHGITTSSISKGVDGSQHFELRDAEGNPIAFIQPSLLIDDPPPAQQVSSRLLHGGFVVKDLAKENRFYVDLLGFRLYWYGGFKDDGTDWYEIQVPDGDDWIEYMLNISPDADHKELGIQNHFSLGVKNAQSAAAELRARGLSSFDGPEIGRDGKSSLDAYDPDGTRVEVMEFTPAQTPCCHAYTAAHPKP